MSELNEASGPGPGAAGPGAMEMEDEAAQAGVEPGAETGGQRKKRKGNSTAKRMGFVEKVKGPVSKLEGHKSSITALSIGGEGDGWLASGSEDGSARIWDLEKRKSVRCFLTPKDEEGNQAEIASVAFGKQDFSNLVAVAHQQTVAVFDVRDPAVVSKKPAFGFTLHQDDVTEVTIDSDNGLVSAADDSGEVLVYDLRTKKLSRRLQQCHENICAAACFRAGQRWQLISAGLDGKVVHWNFNKIRALHSFAVSQAQARQGQMVNPRYPYCLAGHRNGDQISVGLGDGSVTVLDLQQRKQLYEFEAWPNMISCISYAAFAPDAILLAGGSDKRVLVSLLPQAEAERDPLSDLAPVLREALLDGDSDAAAMSNGPSKAIPKRLLSLKCTSQVNAIASTQQGRVYVGDLSAGILEFDLASSGLKA